MCFCCSCSASLSAPPHPLHRELRVFLQRQLQKGGGGGCPSCSDPAGFKLLYYKNHKAGTTHPLSLYLHLSMQYDFSSSLRFINDSLGI